MVWEFQQGLSLTDLGEDCKNVESFISENSMAVLAGVSCTAQEQCQGLQFMLTA